MLSPPSRKTDSVISISSRAGAQPAVGQRVQDRFLQRAAVELHRRNVDRDADCSGQCDRLGDRLRGSTQPPIGTISPVSSAIGMKSAGEISPRVGWFQRISASNEPMRLFSRSNKGW